MSNFINRKPLLASAVCLLALTIVGSASAQIPQILKPDPRTPIDQVPYTITTSGSYYLVDNLTGVVGSDGLIIEADHVTIDLNGFSLLGVSGSLDGIGTIGTPQNISIYNGTVRGWGADGVDLAGAGQLSLKDLKVRENGGDGLKFGNEAIVAGCTAIYNDRNGFVFTDGASLACVRNCLALNNSQNGFHSSYTDPSPGPDKSGSFSLCVARGNQVGFEVTGYELRSCSASQNSIDFQTENCVLTSCDSRSGFIGFYVTSSSMRSCNVHNAGGVAVYLYAGSEMIECSIKGVLATGQAVLRVFDDCTVRNCDIDAGAFPGSGSVYLEGLRARVDGNTIRGQGHSVLISFPLNCTVVRNLIQGTIRNDSGAGNNVAPTENAASSTNPWANLMF